MHFYQLFFKKKTQLKIIFLQIKPHPTGGRTIPGIRINGMNVLAVKQGFAMVREHCSSGKGPFYVEFDTYRYHGHSMSDPGTTYRTREEVGGVRTARDPIDYVKKLLIDSNFYTADELKVRVSD